MTRQQPFSPKRRDRGLSRLSGLTLGAAVGSVGAVFVFAVIAADSFSGSNNQANATTPPSASQDQSASSSSSASTIQPAATPPANGRGRAPVSTGAS